MNTLDEATRSIFYDNGIIGNGKETANVKQVYAVMNEAAEQAFNGKAIAVLDTTTFVSLGNDVLSSDVNVDNFFSALTLLCARTIISERLYQSKFDILELTDAEYGAWVRKIRFKMPEAKPDDSVVLDNGKSVDMYVVNKPEVIQKAFAKIGTWEYYVTLQRYWLKLAFQSESMMERFIGAVMTWVYNRMAADAENLAKMTVNTFVANIADTKREVKLVTLYNAQTADTITAAEALFDEKFLRFAISTMQVYADYMSDMGTRFNDGTVPTFTPSEDRITLINTLFDNRLRTQMLYAAFNDSYLKLDNTRKISFWQSPDKPMSTAITTESGEVTVDNVVAIMFDRDALGTYRHAQEANTTPYNARGRYVNTFWFVDYQPINDLSENGIVFTLN